MRLGYYQFDKTENLTNENKSNKFNIFSIISNIFRELYNDSKEVMKAILN